MDQLPVIGYFAALPLRKNLTLGDWVVGPDFAEVPWLSDGFKRFAEAVVPQWRSAKVTLGAWR
jgi:hypothetical protein